MFVFTFARHTLSLDAGPVAGQALTFTQFAGSPQIFVTAEQLAGELGSAGFDADPDLQLRELNPPPALSEGRAFTCRVEGPPGRVRVGGAPVIYEAGFRYTGA